MQLTVDSGQLTVGWEVKKLGDVCHIIGGGTPSKSNEEFYIGEIPWATVRDMKNEIIFETECRITEEAVKKSSTNIIKKGNVVIATRVGLGKVCMVAQDTAINQDLRGIIPKNNNQILVRFLFWWLKSIAHLIKEEGTGATVQGVKVTFVNSLKIPIPTLSEQKRIVAIMDEAFEGIDRAIANTEKNLANSRELFESYLNAIFTKKGNGWTEEKLGDIATFRNGLNFTKSSKGELIKIVGVKDFQNHFWIQEYQLDSVTIDAELKEIDILRKGDILTVRSNGNKELIGRCILAGDISEKTSHSGFTIRIRIESENIYPQFIVYSLKSRHIRKQLIESGGGINISSLNQQGLSLIKLSFPTFVEQKAIVANIDELAIETQRLEAIYQQKIAALNELKQSILQKAFTGELTADSANQTTKAAQEVNAA